MVAGNNFESSMKKFAKKIQKVYKQWSRRKEIQEDLTKPKDQRIRGIINFYEYHEEFIQLYRGPVEDEAKHTRSRDELSSDDTGDDILNDTMVDKQQVRSKKKVGKAARKSIKGKRDTKNLSTSARVTQAVESPSKDVDDYRDFGSDDLVDTEDDEKNANFEDDEESDNNKSPSKDVDDYRDFGHDDLVDTEDDEKDANFEEDEESDNEKDSDFEDSAKPPKKRKRGSSVGGEGASKTTRGPGRPKKKRAKEDYPEKPPKRSEKAELKKCEDAYLPIVYGIEGSLKAKDYGELEVCLDELRKSIPELTGSFMRIYVAGVLKDTKAFLKDNRGRNELLRKEKEIRNLMKDAWNEKEKLIPSDFKWPSKKKRPLEKAKKTATKYPKAPDIARTESKALLSKAVAGPEAGSSSKGNGAMRKNANTGDGQTRKSDGTVGLAKQRTGHPAAVAKKNHPVALPKPERKQFSLGKLMSKEKDSAVRKVGAPSVGPSKLPSWLSGPYVPSPQDDEVLGDENRSVALEFLREAALQLPQDKISVDSVAYSLEEAIFKWAKKTIKDNQEESWAGRYWERVHAVVAAICGKKSMGTLAHQIMKGEFPTAEKVAELKEEKLLDSFEGRAIRR